MKNRNFCECTLLHDILQYCYRNMEFVLMSMVFPTHDKQENYYIFSQWKTFYYLLIISWFYVVCLLFSSQDISKLKYITSLYHKPKASEYLAFLSLKVGHLQNVSNLLSAILRHLWDIRHISVLLASTSSCSYRQGMRTCIQRKIRKIFFNLILQPLKTVV